ncbi:putative kelch-like protein 10 [Apostichopus japonicus]|uniref:Putative kelch-like protein 10 n=1 Tax=Stichopus japonicus TaxID=307972 RepID=A0A2G8L0P2_STIJA|nr:putative kelch-like protein 10 [Apostichopus japonicus]
MRQIQSPDKPVSLVRAITIIEVDACSTRHQDGIIIVGGFNGSECLGSVELYDPRTDEWRDLPRMLSRRSGVGVVSFRDYAYAVGGFNGLTRLNTMDDGKPVCPSGKPVRDVHHRSNFGLAVLDDMIFVIGGFNGITTIYNVECYDPDNNEWYDACDMNVYRSALSVGVVNGLPNVEDFTWPRDRQLPPPTLTPSHANMQQVADLQHDHNSVAAAVMQQQAQEQEQRDGRRQPRQNQQPAHEAEEENQENGEANQEAAVAAETEARTKTRV